MYTFVFSLFLLPIMACMDGPQPIFKHYCRVCKKGFMCGRALGGHMRAHGIGDDNASLEDDDPATDWDGSDVRGSNKRMYQLRTNPNRLKSCRTCENCGKEFLSWKSFLEHGKCSSDDASESLISSPDSDGEEEGDGRRGGGWSKRRRSLRSKVGCLASSYIPYEEDDILLARCLLQLANTTVDRPEVAMVEPEESCASASREEERRNPVIAYFKGASDKAKGVSNPKGLFECKACNKVFNSHQALGGHRASHKKVKGCYAAKQDQTDDFNHNIINNNNNGILMTKEDHNNEYVITNEGFFQSKPNNSPNAFQFEQGAGASVLIGAARRKSKVHECSICHRIFTSGQALGGHKRCHWITSNAMPVTDTTPPSFPNKIHLQQDNIVDHLHHQSIHHKIDASSKLDLNIPAWVAEMSSIRGDPQNPLSFEVSTEMHLQPWIGHHPMHNVTQGDDKNHNNNNNNVDNVITNDNVVTEDEVDSKLKMAKLSDLKDMAGTSSNSSQWLQVGIGSGTETDSTTVTIANT